MAWFGSIAARFCGFSAVGAVSTLLSIAIMAAMNEIVGANAYVSYATAYVLTILFSYFANALLVYRTRPGICACAAFFAAYASGMAVGALLLAAAKRIFPAANDTLLGCCVMPFTIVWNFFFVNRILGRGPARRRASDPDNAGQCQTC